MTTPNEQFQKVLDTLNDVTQIGPLAQKIALHKGARIPIDLSTSGTVFQPISFGTLKQAALGTTVIIDVTATGKQDFRFTLNKEAGAADGSVAEALQKELLLNTVGDTALCRFYKSGPVLTEGEISVTSDDANVLFNVARNKLFDLAAEKVRGEAVLEIRATSVPPNVRTVQLLVANNAYVNPK
jgi:hypothetical protein